MHLCFKSTYNNYMSRNMLLARLFSHFQHCSAIFLQVSSSNLFQLSASKFCYCVQDIFSTILGNCFSNFQHCLSSFYQLHASNFLKLLPQKFGFYISAIFFSHFQHCFGNFFKLSAFSKHFQHEILFFYSSWDFFQIFSLFFFLYVLSFLAPNKFHSVHRLNSIQLSKTFALFCRYRTQFFSAIFLQYSNYI